MSSSRAASLRQALSERVVVADGAMGSMLQGVDLTLEDFQGHEGCNEILSVSRPDVVRSVHDAYFAVGVDCVETNTFGTNRTALGEYGLEDRIFELAEAATSIARASADSFATPERPRWVLGSAGGGTKLPSLGHIPFAVVRDGYQAQVEGMISGGVDAVIVETSQDLLQAKAAVIGAKRAMAAAGADLPLIVSVTVETTGVMLLGSEIGAALTALEPLGIDLIGLNCATGPQEYPEYLRHLAKYAQIGLSCMPNAGLPVLTKDGSYYPLTPEEFTGWHERLIGDYGVNLVGGCCGTTPEHLGQLVERVHGTVPPAREPQPEPSAASLYQSVAFRQDSSYLAIGERTNANGSKAFREAMIAEDWDACVEIARAQIRDGAHLLDVCVDYVGRDGVADMREIAGRFATASTLPLVLDSTEPAVLRAGLECLGGRAVINSVNYEDGDGPESRFTRIMELVSEHGAGVIALTIDEQGQARTAEQKVAIAERLIADITQNWGVPESAI
jgi:5-methyltetrahydrofolate--homocysteine methyltransferase